jgi:toxin ParE1/3/4
MPEKPDWRYKLLKSHQAQEDLVNIWLYTLKEWGIVQADYYLDELDDAFQQLKTSPRLGVARDDVRPGYCSLQVKKHIAYYRLSDRTIELMRVLYGRMDPDTQL